MPRINHNLADTYYGDQLLYRLDRDLSNIDLSTFRATKAGVALTLLVFTLDIGHWTATSATLLSRPAKTMSEVPKDQKSRCPASKQVISCPMAVK